MARLLDCCFKDAFLKNYLDLIAFLLQGLPSNGTLTAVMAYMVEDVRARRRTARWSCRATRAQGLVVLPLAWRQSCTDHRVSPASRAAWLLRRRRRSFTGRAR